MSIKRPGPYEFPKPFTHYNTRGLSIRHKIGREYYAYCNANPNPLTRTEWEQKYIDILLQRGIIQ